jgi:hypothetical protein
MELARVRPAGYCKALATVTKGAALPGREEHREFGELAILYAMLYARQRCPRFKPISENGSVHEIATS